MMMKGRFFWKGWLVLSLLGLFALSVYLSSDNREENYLESVKETLQSIQDKARILEGIDAGEDTDSLLAVYDEIIGLAEGALKLTPPTVMESFHEIFRAYMEGTREGYTLIREGTAQGDFSKVSQGVELLSSLDGTFLQGLTQ